MSDEEMFNKLRLQSIIDSKLRDIAYQSCSAISGDGIWEGIGKLGDIMEALEKNLPHQSIDQSKREKA